MAVFLRFRSNGRYSATGLPPNALGSHPATRRRSPYTPGTGGSAGGRASSIRSVVSVTVFASPPSLNPRPPGSTRGPGLRERTLLDQAVADRSYEAAQLLAEVIRTAPPAPGRPATWRGRPRPRARSRQRSPCAHAGRRLVPPAPRPCRPAAGSGSSPRLCEPDS